MAGFRSRVVHMWQDRWLGLVFGMWMQGCGGISYTFSLYSAVLKSQLEYNQEMTDALGTSKDIGGNVGIVSGLLIDCMPAWGVLLVGALMHLAGYSMLYMAAMGFVKPPFWQMCLFIMLGTNGATWFNTAVLVTCIRNFQGDRGVVVGLLKGFIGLSGAIFTQVYAAMYAPHTAPFLLLCAVVPPVCALLSMLVIRPRDPPPATHSGSGDVDASRFRFLYVLCVSLALYLMVVIVLQDAFQLSTGFRKVFMTIMIIVLLLPISVPWEASRQKGGASAAADAGADTVSLLPLVSSSSLSVPRSPSSGQLAPQDSPKLLSSGDSTPIKSSSSASDLQKFGSLAVPPSAGLKLGQDHTLLQAVRTVDYWLLFFAMGCGTGSGLTAINNLGQMAEALGSKSIGAFVALVSVWNFLGRMGAGYISESYMKRYGTPRPLFMLVVQGGMGCAHLLFASAVPWLLYVGSAMVGMAHGAHWTLMVATASELFGLQHFGALYNTLSISATIGSYCLSVKLAGYIYDRQAAIEAAEAVAKGIVTEGPHRCLGPNCFRPTFLIMSLVCCCGILALTRLVARTRRLYQDIHKAQADR